MMTIVETCIKTEDVKLLARIFFPEIKAAQHLTPTQCEIVRTIAFQKTRRLSISAHTRFGKTQSVALGIALYILLNKGKKILFIGPTREQAEIIRDYMAELVIGCPQLCSMAMFDAKGPARLKKEASKRRMTFRNGCEYRILTAHGDASSVMGHGGDVIVIDEAAMITRDAYAKITRMLGDDPENSVLIEMYNPWTKDCMAFDHYISGRYTVYQIGWEQGIAEGRITQDYIEEKREEYRYTPLAFQVLYDSEFPDEAEDQLISFHKIRGAVNRFTLKKGDFVIGADIADKGMDRTVIMTARMHQDYYEVTEIYAEAKSESVEVAGRILAKMDDRPPAQVNIDTIGIGVGVVSMVKSRNPRRWTNVQGCHFGMKSIGRKYANKKAEMYWRLKLLFEKGIISIPDNAILIKELNAMTWKHTESGAIKIVDPEGYSPDYADALVYTVWGQDKGIGYHVA